LLASTLKGRTPLYCSPPAKPLIIRLTPKIKPKDKKAVRKNYRVFCTRGVHPYEPIVTAGNPDEAVALVKDNFSRMYGKKIKGKEGCTKSGEECRLTAVQTAKKAEG